DVSLRCWRVMSPWRERRERPVPGGAMRPIRVAALLIAFVTVLAANAHALQPSPRVGPTAIYDPLSQRYIMFGGTINFYDPDASNVFALSMTPGQPPVWTSLTQTLAPGGGRPPDPGFHYTSVYDSRRQRVLFYGGCRDANLPFGWTLNLVGNNLFSLQLSTLN